MIKTRISGSGSADDTQLLSLLETVSREIEGRKATNRKFFVKTAAIPFTLREDCSSFLVPDLVSVTSFDEDAVLSGSYDTPWAVTDYILKPYDAEPTARDGTPYTEVEVDVNAGTYSKFYTGQRRYRITGKWGYCDYTVATGSVLSAALTDTTGTELNVADVSKLEAGWTLLIDNEQMYVSKIGNKVTVERGVNGTTAATHVISSTIKRYVYPGPIVEATLMQASRLWTRRLSGYAANVGLSETGQLFPLQGFDKDVQELFWPYRKYNRTLGVV
jgi:hypothetical protein